MWPWQKWALEQMQPSKAETILDLGCGKGDMARHLITEMGPRGEIVAVDPSPELVHEAETLSYNNDMERRIQWMIGTHHHIFYRDKSFDKILSEFVLKSVDPDDSLGELQRLVSNHGRVVLLCYGAANNQVARISRKLWEWVVSYHRFVGLPVREYLSNPLDQSRLESLLPAYHFSRLSSRTWLGGFIYGLTMEYHEP
ncbi:MAG: methyltransferase domain-containing protein [Firmicutes bacterium]|jgi:ubiquinone/menaquinone biosynthesis C-methylase UbiE|nr:methyltransferase domain-containing protein [Bacillota bacterium]